MAEEHHKNHINWGLIVIGSLVAILLAVVVWFGSDVFDLYRRGVISPAISRMHRRPLGSPALSPDQIQGWMTFRYVNYVFNLPANYLAGKLDIANPKYPNITLSKFASEQKISSPLFIQAVRDAVASYQGGESP